MKLRKLIAIIGAVSTLTMLGVLNGCVGQNLKTDAEEIHEAAPGTLVDWRYLSTVTVPGHRLQMAHIYRFSYITTSDKREVATARIAIPDSNYASYDLVAYLHGTIGFADHCAPSVMPGFGFESPLNPLAGDMVGAGRVVVMPDYPGLGSPGPHRYVERDATGRSVWDALTAGRRLVPVVQPTSVTTSRVLLAGHSQGGHAVFAALATQVASDEFEVVGALAFSPPGDPTRHAQLVASGDARPAPFAWALTSYARAYPDAVVVNDWFTPQVAAELPQRIAKRCAPKVKLWLGNDASEIFSESAMTSFAAGDLPSEVLARERLDAFDTDTPILVLHGASDTLIPPELSETLAARLSERGNDVDWRSVKRAGHLDLPRRARAQSGAWVEARFGDGSPRF